MFLYLLKSVKSIYRQPYFLQWTVAILCIILAGLILYTIIDAADLLIFMLLIPLTKPIEHFLAVPLLRLSGVLNYYSPMLIGVWTSATKMEIHNGSSFDYLVNMRWKQKGIRAKRRIMRYYLKGFLKIIDDVENKRLPENTVISGVSYFFSSHTASKIGFTLRETGMARRLLFMIDYVNLFLMYSYSNGRITFPQLSRLKKAEITANILVQSKKKIVTLLTGLNRINQHTIRPGT